MFQCLNGIVDPIRYLNVQSFIFIHLIFKCVNILNVWFIFAFEFFMFDLSLNFYI